MPTTLRALTSRINGNTRLYNPTISQIKVVLNKNKLLYKNQLELSKLVGELIKMIGLLEGSCWRGKIKRNFKPFKSSVVYRTLKIHLTWSDGMVIVNCSDCIFNC